MNDCKTLKNLKEKDSANQMTYGVEDRYFSKSELLILREKFKDSETIEIAPKASAKDIR
jgi:hypothetical protein